MAWVRIPTLPFTSQTHAALVHSGPQFLLLSNGDEQEHLRAVTLLRGFISVAQQRACTQGKLGKYELLLNVDAADG